MILVLIVCGSGVARMTELAGNTMGMRPQRLRSSQEFNQTAEIVLGYIICSHHEEFSQALYVFLELDLGRLLAAAAAEGTQQSNKQQWRNI